MSYAGFSASRSLSGANSPSPSKVRQVDASQKLATDFTECVKCSSLLLKDISDRWILQCDQNCPLCSTCFSSEVSNLGCAPSFLCPRCNSKVTSWTVQSMKNTLTRASTIRSIPTEETHALKFPDEDKDPVRYYEEFEKYKNFARISMVSYDEESDTVVNLGTCLNANNCNVWSEAQARTMESIAMNFHGIFAGGDKEGENVRFDPLAAPTSEALTDVALGDTSGFHRFIYALATGTRLEEHKTGNVLWDKVVKTTWGVKETLRYVRSSNPSAIQDIMGAQLLAQNVPDSAFAILNDFGIAPSKKAVLDKDKGYVTLKLLDGIEKFKDKYTLVITYYDNMGFKQRGKRVGYKQYTKQIHVVVTREELIELGASSGETLATAQGLGCC